jgi:hypothetical protein
MRQKICLLALALMMVFASVVAVQAQTLDFSIFSPYQGSIAFDGVIGHPLVGTNILVSSVTGFDTLINPDVTLPITNGRLDFTTGGCLGNFIGIYFFDTTGGSLTIRGDIAQGQGTENLLTSTSFVVPSLPIVAVGPFGRGGTVVMSFTDTKALDLVNYFGESNTGPNAGNLNLSFLGAINFNTVAAFSSTRVLSGDVWNVLGASGAPIPGSLLLLGSGIVGLAGIGLRRKS